MLVRSVARLLALSVLAVVPRGAHAYVREVTNSGLPVAWHYPCVTMQIYVGAPPPVLKADDYFSASERAAAVWSYPALAATDIRLTIAATVQDSADVGDVGYDKRNVIVFRKDTWCRQPSPIGDSGAPEPDCYPSSALAVTSVFKNGKTGEILDTDIEFNAVDYSWGDLVSQPGLANSTTADFQNALTHELGHVLGLDHNCFAASDKQPRLIDNTGAPEVDCYGNPLLPQAVADATMYPSVQLNDTLRRDLSPDDKQGICDIYPHLHDVCPPHPPNGGCSVVASDSSGGSQTAILWTAGGLLTACLAFLRRRLKV
jgi:hypothetical protein